MKGFGSYKVLLKPKHFEGMNVSMTERGLEFDYEIDDRDREEELWDLDDLERKKGKPTRVTVNPVDLSLPDLKAYFSAAQKRYAPDETISTSYTLSKAYDLKWKLSDWDECGIGEGQQFVLVAWSGRKPMGYVVFDVALTRNAAEGTLLLFCEIALVYVHPNGRNRGYGTDLAIACGIFLRDVLDAAYKASPSRYKISSVIWSDYESEGGEHFVERVWACLQDEVEYLQDVGKRRTIQITEVELDAGY